MAIAQHPALQIDASLVRGLIADQFPQWSELCVAPVKAGGWDNRTFHLGDKMLVRLPSAAEYAQQVEKEQHWLPKLAPHLPVAIPSPLARGTPGRGYPWKWSVYKWLAGDTASKARVQDLKQFATTLGRFLAALQRVNPTDGPTPGEHNFFRGGALSTYDDETRRALFTLNNKIDAMIAISLWEAATATTWRAAPVWLHGDVSAGNLLVENGQLSGVIDFGCSAVGDPACDLAIAWTFFDSASRKDFLSAAGLDDETVARGRGWALWKAAIIVAGQCEGDAAESGRVLKEVLDDYNGNRTVHECPL